VYDVTVSKRDDAQVVKEVHVKTHSSCLAVTGSKIYSLFKNIKSLCFSIKKEGKRVVFTGHGYGHHLGLCQWGTRQMVREGWDCKSILRFFYPDTTFMKVRVKSDATV
jgi:stage II sporulation protein D